jgi:hypothetical protein
MSTPSTKSQFLFVFRNPQDQAEPTPDEMQKIFGAWMAWIKGMKDKGIYVGGQPLEEGGTLLRGPNGKSLTDGPFVEAKEIVGGYVIIQADSLDAAATLAKGCPGLGMGGTVEVRPIREAHGM